MTARHFVPSDAEQLLRETPLGAGTAGNLWPEPLDGPRDADLKDRLENALRAQVCSGAVLLAVAQLAIATNWEDAYRTFVGSPSHD